MEGAKTNIAYNCLERNIQKGLGKRIAYQWEGNEPGDQQTITYDELLDKVPYFCLFLSLNKLLGFFPNNHSCLISFGFRLPIFPLFSVPREFAKGML
jgi:acyl-coenzyme A synthetase/AMP-(fatty) acid ligase